MKRLIALLLKYNPLGLFHLIYNKGGAALDDQLNNKLNEIEEASQIPVITRESIQFVVEPDAHCTKLLTTIDEMLNAERPDYREVIVRYGTQTLSFTDVRAYSPMICEITVERDEDLTYTTLTITERNYFDDSSQIGSPVKILEANHVTIILPDGQWNFPCKKRMYEGEMAES